MSTPDTRSLEDVYDEEVSPLMTQIIAICKRANIPFHAGFALDDDLACTTHIDPGESAIPEDMASYDAWRKHYDPANRSVRGESSLTMITVRNAAGEVTQMTAVAADV